MPSLGQRLGNIANTHRTLKNYKKKYMRNMKTYGFTTVKEFQNYEAQKNLNNTTPISNNSNTNSNTTNTSNKSFITRKSNSSCIITPGGQKMKKMNGKWVKCALGGKRKTARRYAKRSAPHPLKGAAVTRKGKQTRRR